MTGDSGSAGPLFDGFSLSRVELPGVTIRLRHGGSGPPLLLLHGHPQTHVMWHRLAPLLAARYTLVMPDLRGYGQSSKPPSADDHAAYSKRAMALDGVRLMARYGFERFAVVGHDRGGRVAYRMALDHPDRVSRLAVLDILPTAETWRRLDRKLGLDYWHWFFLAQPAPLPERLICADPDAFYFRSGRELFDPAALDDYLSAIRDPATVHAMCEDYRAGATIDVDLDEADHAERRRIGCPLLVLWSGRGELEGLDPLATWREWATDVRGSSVDAGHFLAEEAPSQVADRLREFLLTSAPR